MIATGLYCPAKRFINVRIQTLLPGLRHESFVSRANAERSIKKKEQNKKEFLG